MKRFTRKRKLLFLVISGTLISFMTLIASGFEEHNDHEPLFPFLISYDSPDNVVNMSHLLKGPAGTDGFLRIENGRFINDAGPIRLNGTNLTGPANFPTHVEAERLAARLARFGINCVRLHYMDDFYGNFLEEKQQGILTDDPETQRNLDSAQLDKLDYLIAELKKRGIYVNINLHVARKWDERDDFTDKNNRPQHDKGVDNFYPRMIELQKEYARKLLTHVNPYTKLAYTDDQAVALVEINNENGIFREYMRGAIDNLPNPYRGELVKQWNSWLKNKYGNSEKMYIAWEHSSQTEEDQSERIPEGSFSKNDPLDEKLWIVQKGGADVTLDVSGGVLKVTTSGKAKDKFPKIFRSAINVKKDQVYNVSFRIRKTSDGNPTQLGFAIADGVKGWRSLGVLRTINVGKEWLEVQSTFVALHDSEKAQIQLTRFAEGNYEIDDISLSGSEINFDKTKSIENASVDIVNRKDVLSPTASRDFIHFLYDTEAKYWKEMYDFLRDELKVKSPIAGGQLSFTPTTTQTQLDFIDNHAYWTHPSINKNWRIKNSSMVNNMQTIRRLAGERVEGFPYTISEYNHPFPNQYGAEGQPMLRAYGALQGWDGVFQYTYNHRQDAEPEMNTYFFSMAARTDVLAHMPACAAIFLRGDVSEAQKSVIANLSEDEYLEKFLDNRSMIINFSRLGIDTRSSLIHRTAIDYSGKNKGMPFFSVDNLPNSKVLMSDNGELLWNTEIENAGYFTVNTENTKLFTGFPADRTISMGDVSLSVGKTRLDWATISLVSKNESGFGEDGKSSNILLTATGVSQNKGMKVQHFPDAMMRIDDWGSGPVMVEGIPATISLPADAKRVKCYALDERGERKSEVPVMASVGHGSNIEIKPAYQTIWYEIEVR